MMHLTGYYYIAAIILALWHHMWIDLVIPQGNLRAIRHCLLTAEWLEHVWDREFVLSLFLSSKNSLEQFPEPCARHKTTTEDRIAILKEPMLWKRGRGLHKEISCFSLSWSSPLLGGEGAAGLTQCRKQFNWPGILVIGPVEFLEVIQSCWYRKPYNVNRKRLQTLWHSSVSYRMI